MPKKKLLILALTLLFISIFMIFGAKNRPDVACMRMSGDEKNKCVIHLLDKYINKHQVGAALAFLNNYQIQDKNFYATDCHGVVHYVGDKAYEFYKQGYKIDFGKFSSICVYGFYHAFTSSFVLSGDEAGARKFCDGIKATSPNEAVGCYHGIGHGAIHYFNEDYRIVDPATIISKSTELCQNILNGDSGLADCMSGVYDGIGDVLLDGSSVLYKNLTPQKIYQYCISQPDKYKDDCYQNISHLVYRKTHINFGELVDYVMKSPLINNKKAAIEGLATIYIVDLKEGDFNVGVSICQKLPTDIKMACLVNMGYKFAADALKNKHYDAARDFCANNLLSNYEKEHCFAMVVGRLTSFYSRHELVSICRADQIDLYKNICLNELNEN